MILVPRDGQNLFQSMFSCMLIPFSMFLLDSERGKVKYSPLYGRESKVTILVGRHWRPNNKCTFLAGPPYPPQRTFYDSGPTEGINAIPKYFFLQADLIFNILT